MMSKLWLAATVITTLVAGGVFAGLGDAPTKTHDGNIDVSKPSFLTILLRKPDVYNNIPEDVDITIFAPSDEAFSKLNPEVLNNIMKPENEEVLKKIMNAHVVRGEYYTKDLKNGMTFNSEEGKELKITVDENGKIKVNDSQIIEPDGIMRRGSMHVIDKVLIPPDVSLDDLKGAQ